MRPYLLFYLKTVTEDMLSCNDVHTILHDNRNAIEEFISTHKVSLPLPKAKEIGRAQLFSGTSPIPPSVSETITSELVQSFPRCNDLNAEDDAATFLHDTVVFVYKHFLLEHMKPPQKFALVLFDHDGLTCSVETRRLGEGFSHFEIGQQCQLEFDGKPYLVEIIALADSWSDLDDCEDRWGDSDRAFSISLVRASRRDLSGRRGKYGGYLQIIVADSETSNSEESSQDPFNTPQGETIMQVELQTSASRTEEQRDRSPDNLQVSKTVSQKRKSARALKAHESQAKRRKTLKAPPTKTRPGPSKTLQKNKRAVRRYPGTSKQGTQNRTISVLYEGSSDLSRPNKTPTRKAGHTEELSTGQKDILDGHVEAYQRGCSNVSTQTDPVMIIDEETDIQALVWRQFHSSLKSMNDNIKELSMIKRVFTDISNELKKQIVLPARPASSSPMCKRTERNILLPRSSISMDATSDDMDTTIAEIHRTEASAFTEGSPRVHALAEQTTESPQTERTQQTSELPELVMPRRRRSPQMIMPQQTTESPQIVATRQTSDLPQMVLPQQTTESPQMVLPQQTTESPQMVLPQQTTESPQMVLPQQTTESPQMVLPQQTTELPQQTTESPQMVLPQQTTEQPQMVLPQQTTESPQVVLPQQTTESPQMILPQQTTESPQMELPQQTTESPHMVLPQQTTELPQMVLPQQTTESPHVVLPQQTTESPQMVLPQETTESPHMVLSQQTTESQEMVIPQQTTESPQMVLPQQTTELPQMVLPQETTESPHMVLPQQTTESPQMVLPQQTTESQEMVLPQQTTELPQTGIAPQTQNDTSLSTRCILQDITATDASFSNIQESSTHNISSITPHHLGSSNPGKKKKKILKLECRPNATLCAISDPNVPVGLYEFRVVDDVQWRLKNKTRSPTQFMWHLTQELYTEDELFNHNFHGNRFKLELSPRRKHAMTHAFINSFGWDEALYVRCIDAINCGLRHLKR